MEIADEVAHRALSYVEAVNRQGHRLTVDEFDAYIDQPARLSRQIGYTALTYLTASLGAFSTLVGRTEEESVLDWLKRLNWLEVSRSHVSVTLLGNAVLRELEAQGVASDGPGLVVFTEKDPFAYARVISHIAKIKAEYLADPYLRLEALPTLIEFASLRRMLIGSRADVKGLAIAVNGLPDDRKLEVRISDGFHDRYAIPTSGPLVSLGTSLSGFGKRVAAMTTLSPPGADEIRKTYERLWGDAKPLLTPQKTMRKTPAKKKASRAKTT